MPIKLKALAPESGGAGVPVILRVVTPNSATNTDVATPVGINITSITIRKLTATGSTTDDVAILTGTAVGVFTAVDVTAATNLNTVTAGSMVACGVVEATRVIPAGGSLRVTTTKTTNCEAEIVVTGFRV